MFFALLSAFANSIEVTADKIILGKRGINLKKFIAVSMVAISLFSALVFPFLGRISIDFYTPKYLTIFAGIIVTAFFYNLAFFYALSKDDLCNIEPLVLMDRPVTVLMAALFFTSERSILPLIFTIIGVAALIISRTEKHHFKMNKVTLVMLAFVFLISIESQLVKVILPVISPLALYAFRCAILAILFLIFLKPDLSTLKKTQYFQILLIGAVTIVEYVAHFYAILYLGIVQSTLISLLGPVLILFYSKFLLKEKLTFKKAVADAIIVLCVAATFLIK